MRRKDAFKSRVTLTARRKDDSRAFKELALRDEKDTSGFWGRDYIETVFLEESPSLPPNPASLMATREGTFSRWQCPPLLWEGALEGLAGGEVGCHFPDTSRCSRLGQRDTTSKTASLEIL